MQPHILELDRRVSGQLPMASPREVLSLARLRAAVWITSCLLAILDAWVRRFNIYADGISYLEIARAYAHHDWTNAINGYWSPAMSWLAAVVFLVLRPSPEWELPAFHLVDLLAVLAALPCYEFLLKKMESRLEIRDLFTFRLVGYAIFIWTTQFVLYAGEIRPDPLLLSPVFLVFGLTLTPRNVFSTRYALGSGALLAFCYFVKTAMFPVGLLAILVLGVRYGIRRGSIALGCFLLLAAPFIAALSVHCHRLTLGESGRINYSWEVNGVRRLTHWQGGPHSTQKILETPPVYAFDTAVSGSFPPWREPSFFYDGVPVRFNALQQVKAIANNGAFAVLLLLACPGLLVALWSCKRGCRTLGWVIVWPMVTISACAICLYAAVFVDKRYLAPFVAGLALTAAAKTSFDSEKVRSHMRLAAVGTCLFFLLIPVAGNLGSLLTNTTKAQGNPHLRVAQEVQRAGLKENDRIAYVGHSMDAYWATLLNVRIVAETPLDYVDHGWLNKTATVDYSGLLSFWHGQSEALAAMKRAGATAVFADEIPKWGDLSGWKRISSDYQDRELWMRWL